jgi:hypothetical protein
MALTSKRVTGDGSSQIRESQQTWRSLHRPTTTVLLLRIVLSVSARPIKRMQNRSIQEAIRDLARKVHEPFLLLNRVF